MEQRRVFLERKKIENPSKVNNMDMMKIMVERGKAKKQREDMIVEKNELKIKWEVNKESIKVMENKLELLKNKMEFIKGILVDHYLRVFKEGTDIRFYLN